MLKAYMATIVPILNSIDGAVTSSEVFLVRLSSQGCVNLDGKRPRFLRSPKKRNDALVPTDLALAVNTVVKCPKMIWLNFVPPNTKKTLGSYM
jgi:hypothetical protein